MNQDLFLGHPISYWLELQKRADKLDVVDLLDEIAELRGKVSFYESRFDQIETFRNKNR